MEVLQSHVGARVRLSVTSEVSVELLQSHTGATVRLSMSSEVSVEVLQSHVGIVARLSVTRDGSVSVASVPLSEWKAFALSNALETPGPGKRTVAKGGLGRL